MAKADPLAQLKDIHLPDAVGWWPIAPGWYGLMILGISLIIAIFYLLYKKHLHALAKKEALDLLLEYKKNYQQDHNAQLASARISELLKQVALVYYPRNEVASLYGDEWIQFLNRTGKGINFTPVKAMLLEFPFKTMETANLSPLFNASQRWIKQRGTPCLN